MKMSLFSLGLNQSTTFKREKQTVSVFNQYMLTLKQTERKFYTDQKRRQTRKVPFSSLFLYMCNQINEMDPFVGKHYKMIQTTEFSKKVSSLEACLINKCQYEYSKDSNQSVRIYTQPRMWVRVFDGCPEVPRIFIMASCSWFTMPHKFSKILAILLLFEFISTYFV